MTNIISAHPYPPPNPAPLLIEIICDLSTRLTTVEHLLDLAPAPCATPTAAATAPVREIVEELGNGWRVERQPR